MPKSVNVRAAKMKSHDADIVRSVLRLISFLGVEEDVARRIQLAKVIHRALVELCFFITVARGRFLLL